MSSTDPVNIILIISGSRGQKLLFRYPFRNKKTESAPPVTPTETNFTIHEDIANEPNNPYAISKLTESGVEYSNEEAIIVNNKLFGYEDELLATILSPKSSMCNKNFELKIGPVTFVGFPVLVCQDDLLKNYDACISKEKWTLKEDVTIMMVHVVIAFMKSGTVAPTVVIPTMVPKVMENYHTISKMLGMALRHEENRCFYLSKQREIMLQELDRAQSMDKSSDSEYDFFETILVKSRLAQDLSKVFNQMIETGVAKIRVNGWISLNFSLPHKVHRRASQKVIVDACNYNKYFKRIKPYHTFLLFGIKEREVLIQSVPVDASPALVRLIRMYNPVKSFQVLSQDADISLPQIFQIVAHLVYWGKCNVIYPLAESNVYVISEHAHTEVDCKYTTEFIKEFPQKSLHKILATFSSPVTLGDYRNPLGSKKKQQEQVQIVTWLLKRRLLKQLHTYVYFMPQLVSDDKFPAKNEFFFAENSILRQPHMNKIFKSLSYIEQVSVLEMFQHVDENDISMFLQMTKYMRGQHHLEEIMYYENRRRSELLILIDKFRNLLITVQHEDLATSQWL